MNSDGLKYLGQEIVWHETDDTEFPYEANRHNERMIIRLNDFPEEPLYTLIVNDVVLCDFDQWPKHWHKASG